MPAFFLFTLKLFDRKVYSSDCCLWYIRLLLISVCLFVWRGSDCCLSFVRLLLISVYLFVWRGNDCYLWYIRLLLISVYLCEEVVTAIFGTLDCCWYLCICISDHRCIVFWWVCILVTGAPHMLTLTAQSMLEHCLKRFAEVIISFQWNVTFGRCLPPFFSLSLLLLCTAPHSFLFAPALPPGSVSLHYFTSFSYPPLSLSIHLHPFVSPSSPTPLCFFFFFLVHYPPLSLFIHLPPLPHSFLCPTSSLSSPTSPLLPLHPSLPLFSPISHSVLADTLPPTPSSPLPHSASLSSCLPLPTLLPPPPPPPPPILPHSPPCLPLPTLLPPPPPPFCLTLLHLFPSPPNCPPPPPPIQPSPSSPSHLSSPPHPSLLTLLPPLPLHPPFSPHVPPSHLSSPPHPSLPTMLSPLPPPPPPPSSPFVLMWTSTFGEEDLGRKLWEVGPGVSRVLWWLQVILCVCVCVCSVSRSSCAWRKPSTPCLTTTTRWPCPTSLRASRRRWRLWKTWVALCWFRWRHWLLSWCMFYYGGVVGSSTFLKRQQGQQVTLLLESSF